jgi:hypothetical protein
VDAFGGGDGGEVHFPVFDTAGAAVGYDGAVGFVFDDELEVELLVIDGQGTARFDFFGRVVGVEGAIGEAAGEMDFEVLMAADHVETLNNDTMKRKIKKKVQAFTPGPWRFYKDTRHGPWNTQTNTQGSPYYYQWWIHSDTRKHMAVMEVPYLAKGIKHSAAVRREHAETLREVQANAELIASAPVLAARVEELEQQLLALRNEHFG